MELHFTKNNGLADDAIDSLIELAGDINHAEIVREMILAALKAGQEGQERSDLRLMNSTMKEMRFSTKVFGPYRNIKKVTVFGSARTMTDEPVYNMAFQLGRKLAETGYMVITGGGAGIMQAVNEGAGPEKSFGVNIRLPFEQKPNPVLYGNPRLITYKYFFNRKVAFIKEANAIVLFPGGFGTLDEAMETLTLLQTGKRDPLPLIFCDEPGGEYWSRWIRFFEDELLLQGYILKTDFKLFDRVDSIGSVLEKIKQFYFRYHSLRYVDKQTVIRLNSKIDVKAVARLNDQFSDILVPGGRLCLSGALPAEVDEPEISDLPRLLIDFNKKDFGRFRELIDVINSLS